MFDFAFSEVLVICVVALVVLGPTRLPGVVRKVGRWVGKARAMARDFRQQLENEVTLEELNRMTEKHSRRDPPDAGAAAAAAGASAAAGTSAGASAAGDAAAETSAPAAPQPGDDTYSHAHAEGDAPQPWSPEPELAHDLAAHPDPAPDPTPDPALATADDAPASDPPTADAGKAHP